MLIHAATAEIHLTKNTDRRLFSYIGYSNTLIECLSLKYTLIKCLFLNNAIVSHILAGFY